LKEHYAAIFIMLLLVMTAVFGQLSLSSKANAIPPYPHTIIEIVEPKNTTYANSTVILHFKVFDAYNWTRFTYIIDRQRMNVANLTTTNEHEQDLGTNPKLAHLHLIIEDVEASIVLNKLSEGLHNLTICLSEESAKPATVLFGVDTSPLTLSLLTPLNDTYKPTQLQLNLSFSEPISWTGYSLDGQGNSTFRGNVTLPKLASGLHSLTIYANDTLGNFVAPQTVTFSVAKSETFPTLIIALACGVPVAVCGLLLYRRKYRH